MNQSSPILGSQNLFLPQTEKKADFLTKNMKHVYTHKSYLDIILEGEQDRAGQNRPGHGRPGHGSVLTDMQLLKGGIKISNGGQ